ncbi:SGT1-domain-containing protein [Fomitopsis serialis]|uniref:SGT1-domain-containing protein n=1 Tax=Fomitopsis serialis TaxID=139415 RepID=UPI0020079F88|nr:SGT1-domain-containing protein [Neoantrodia serialis]KAH9937432.1 SGT1-domain-containing protein [Neoantrodia serialis]
MSAPTVSDILNRPPAISEDTLQYALYPRDDLTDRASATTLATLMCSYVDILLPDHLWHRDGFELKVVENADGDGWMLEGRMRVGDCVDDEWCAVWLLKELSAKWDVVMSIFDSDGEFLLIEAAEALPAWVTPTNAENRVWIYQSRLHLIPLLHVSAPSSKPHRRRYPRTKDSDDEGDFTQDDDDSFISVSDALTAVRDPLVDTLAPPEVEQHVWKRISGYPTAARQHVHVTKAYLPVNIAKALTVDASLVQKPIETFYTRDALQLRAAHKMSRFPPEPSVLTSVKMTRTSYAQLVGQKFYSPKIFGRWHEQEGTKEWKWRDIGMKIACGFEMTYQESKGRADATRISAEAMKLSATARKETLKCNPEYAKYIQNLASSGYFKGELEGSQLWNELEDKAVDAFLEARREDDASRPSFATAVNTALSRTEDFTVTALDEDDSDDWLNVDAGSFDSMLEQSFGTKDSSNDMDVDPDSAEDRVAKQQAARLHDFAKKVEEFVEGQGDVEGARFADEQLSDEESSGDDESEGTEESDFIPPAQPQGNMSADERARRQAAMDKLVPPIDASDYGKMPASYHANSQRVAPTTMETEVREDTLSQSSTASGSGPRQRPIRPPIIPRDKYDGVDSDDETDEEDGGASEEDEEDKPQVVGDIEIDMEEEEEEFLEFARQALGVSDEQWGDIVRDRKDRGAYVPSQVVAENKPKAAPTTSNQDVDGAATKTDHIRMPTPGPRPNVNPNLDSFEAVMQAMDTELARMRSSTDTAAAGKTRAAEKGKAKASATDSQDVDIETAMDAELRAALETDQNGGDEDDQDGHGEGLDYNLIKSFLESFKSQSGLSGPVGNLAGRLQPGWTLPRDET